MPSLVKASSGLIYEEDFESASPLWQIYPSNTTQFFADGSQFIFSPGEDKVELITAMPANNFEMQVKFTHTPLQLDSTAGVAVIKDNENRVECTSFREDTESSAAMNKFIKLVRRFDVFTFYASQNGIDWELVGSSKVVDANLISIFFDSSDPSDNNLVVDQIVFQDSSFMSFVGLHTGDILYVKNQSGYNEIFKIVQNSDRLDFDLIDKVFPLKNYSIIINDSLGVEVFNKVYTSIYGGSIFEMNYMLTAYLDHGVEIEPGESLILPTLNVSEREHILTLENNEEAYSATNLKVKIEYFDDYYTSSGVVMLAFESEEQDGSAGEYAEEVIIERIDPGESIDIFFKIEKDTSDITIFQKSNYKFKLIIE